VFNVTDDEPAPPQDVVAFAAELLGVEAPPEIPFETADLTPMARSFYGENKRVSNQRLKDELGFTFRYPDYRVALKALLETV
ncbi:MAG: NAD(P)-dependent oxidoreductase, partial [Pseudomonadota bacterium]|nr:NAD(P)-dependent oxidoreductase [Pseudomonadota bacterium]